MRSIIRISRLGCVAFIISFGLLDAPWLGAADESKESEWIAFFGTYTRGRSEGIYSYRLDLEAGTAKRLSVAKTENPSFLALHPGGDYLYAVNEVNDFRGEATGAVSAYRLSAETGALKFLNRKASGGGAPCHIVVDDAGRHVLVANYRGGSVACLRIEDDGRLGDRTGFAQHRGSSVNPRRQKGPHAHSINLDPEGRFAVAADLGLDKILVYRFDAKTGSLTSGDPPFVEVAPGSGPRHFTFHPSRENAYVINELLCTVTAFDYDAKRGVLKQIQTISTLPGERRDGYSTAEVQVHPSGEFLYGSNRGHDSIVVYSIDSDTGRLTRVENEPTAGKTPRNFGITPDGDFLLAANQKSGMVVVFRVDETTGALSPTGQVIEVPSPVCVKFLPRTK